MTDLSDLRRRMGLQASILPQTGRDSFSMGANSGAEVPTLAGNLWSTPKLHRIATYRINNDQYLELFQGNEHPFTSNPSLCDAHPIFHPFHLLPQQWSCYHLGCQQMRSDSFFPTRRSRGRLVQAKTRWVGSPHPPKRSEKEEFQLNQKHPKVTGESKRWDFHSDKQISITAMSLFLDLVWLG